MALVRFIIIVIRIDDANVIGEHEAALDGEARADVDGQHLIALHVRLESRRHHCHLPRLDDDRARCLQVVAGTCRRLALRQLDAATLILRYDLESPRLHLIHPFADRSNLY